MSQMETGMAGTGMNSMAGMGMSMTISWQTHCVIFLFEGLHAKNAISFFSGCFAVMLLALLTQLLGLPGIRRAFVGDLKSGEEERSKLVFEVNSGLDSDRPQPIQKITQPSPEPTIKRTVPQPSPLLTTTRMILYYATYSLLSLLVMLLAMTMNGYVILAVALGTGIGKTIVALRTNQIGMGAGKIGGGAGCQ